MHLGKTAPSVWLEAGKDDVEVLLCRTNCRGKVFAPTLLSQPFLELYGENIWVAVSVCIFISPLQNPSIIGVIRLGRGSVTVLQH